MSMLIAVWPASKLALDGGYSDVIDPTAKGS